MDKSKLIKTLRDERKAWDELLAEVAQHGMTEPGLAGNWTAKDIVAHVTWYERETAIMMEERALVGSDLWELPQDERNIPILRKTRIAKWTTCCRRLKECSNG